MMGCAENEDKYSVGGFIMKFLSKHWLQAGACGAVRISDDMLGDAGTGR